MTPDPTPVRPISLSGTPGGEPSDLARIAALLDPTDVAAALAFAVRVGLRTTPLRETWELLATAAVVDLGVARAIEPHLDAIGILRQAQIDIADADASFGVFAAEGGDAPVRASDGSGWTLSGTKPWCSLAGVLDRALVTARMPDDARGLFEVDLAAPGVHVSTAPWVARGLAEIPSVPVEFRSVPATPVGPPGWYLDRPGFAWGGIGVAACWYGGAVGIARAVYTRLGPAPEPLLAMHLGAIDEQIESSRRALVEAADLIESGAEIDGPVLAKRARATVAAACEHI